MEQTPADVDVVVPCYKYAHYLDYCVSTILSQRDVSVRVLIVDDCSPDDTPAVAQRLCQDPRVHYTRNENNLGLVGTINVGAVGWAQAPYLVVLSADDALTPGSLARAVSLMNAHPNVGMVYGMAMVFNDKNDEFPVADQIEFESRVVGGGDFIKDFCAHKNGVASPSVLVRNSVQQSIGGYDPELPHTCDVEMWMRFATQGAIGVINAPQAYYRWHSSNMSSSYINRPLNDLKEQLDTCEKVRANWGGGIIGFGDWIAQMRLALVNEACWLAGLAIQRGDAEGARQCWAFVTANHPTPWTLTAWWRSQLKSVIGPALLRRTRLAASQPYVPFSAGQLFGRWPQT